MSFLYHKCNKIHDKKSNSKDENNMVGGVVFQRR